MGRKPNKRTRELIESLNLGGWVVDEPIGKSNIWKARCSCGDHLEYIHSTPSGAKYGENKLAKCKRECWKEEVA